MRKLVTVVWIGLLLMIFATSATQAAVISVGTWSPVISTDIDNDNDPFWDGLSYDGQYCGIGHVLATSNLCNGVPGLNIAGLQYLHDGFGSFVSFDFSGAIGPEGFQIVESITTWQSTSGIIVGAGFHEELFGVAVKGDTAHSAYDLNSTVWKPYITSNHGSFNAGGSPEQSALFRKDMGSYIQYWWGTEDIRILHNTPACQVWDDEMTAICALVSDRDYNDLIISFTQTKPGTPVPEPTMLALLGFGLLGAGAARRRQRN